MTDQINHPPHYNNSPARCICGKRIECIEITRHMDFNIGNVVKYIWRFNDKNGLEDLKKAQWYLNDLINWIEDKDRRNIISAWEKPQDNHVVFNQGCKL